MIYEKSSYRKLFLLNTVQEKSYIVYYEQSKKVSTVNRLATDKRTAIIAALIEGSPV